MWSPLQAFQLVFGSHARRRATQFVVVCVWLRWRAGTKGQSGVRGEAAQRPSRLGRQSAQERLQVAAGLPPRGWRPPCSPKTETLAYHLRPSNKGVLKAAIESVRTQYNNNKHKRNARAGNRLSMTMTLPPSSPTVLQYTGSGVGLVVWWGWCTGFCTP